MEYLVTMTTHVPTGTSEAAVEDMRVREARSAAELARAGRLLRLWRPPLRPGEWRSLGLFSAPDEASLERALASMPLRVWRTDQPSPLSAHPNDPGARAVTPLPGTPRAQVDDVLSREAERARDLAARGNLLRLWSLPAPSGERRALGLWRAGDDAEIAAIVDALPLRPWMTVETTPLTPHPNDPTGR